jgi:hypothetical protein
MNAHSAGAAEKQVLIPRGVYLTFAGAILIISINFIGIIYFGRFPGGMIYPRCADLEQTVSFEPWVMRLLWASKQGL